MTKLFYTAVAKHQAGDFAEAARFYQEVLNHDPNHAEALHHLGLLVQQQGRTDKAIELLTRAVANKPADPVCQNNLANLLRQQSRIDEAIAAYRAAVHYDPAYVTAYFNLGSLLHDRGDVEAAAECYRDVLRLSPEDPEAWNGLGGALKTQGRLNEAIEAYQSALALKADYAEACNNLGLALQAEGSLDGARACYQKAIELDPEYAKAHENLARSRRHGPEDRDEVARLEALANNSKLSEEALISLHFALGKIYDDCGSFERAFAHYKVANRLKRKTASFNREQHIGEVADVIATFSSQFFERRRHYGNPSDQPVFIIGMMRSGTTLVEQIIASHPQVFGAGELMHIPKIADGLTKHLRTDVPYPKCATMIDKVLAQSLAEGYLDRLKTLGGDARRVTDKLPGNFLHLGLIALLFPSARVIHCRRDALDVCLSIYFHRFAYGHPFAYDVSDIAVYYRQYERLMTHWREVLPLEIHEVKYEELVANQEALSRQLIDYCGLPWDDRCLAYYKSKRAVQTASNWQVRQPIYKDSVQRWKNYANYLDRLKTALAGQGE